MELRRVWTAGLKAMQRMVRPVTVPIAIRRLKRLTRQGATLDDLLDIAYGFRFAGIEFAPWQVRTEVKALLELAMAENPRTLVEIGTSNGGTLFLLTCVASEDARIISIDLPKGEFGGGYGRWRIPLYKSFRRAGQTITLIRADSHDLATLEELEVILGGRKLDLLFIDGDHSYDGVKRDLEMYSPLVSRGGIIAVHDIVPTRPRVAGSSGPNLCAGEVPSYWQELKKAHRTTEFVADWEQGSFGIGVVHDANREADCRGRA